jgi:hypothetical protein
MLYVTEIQAISPITGELTTYGGPHVPGISETTAQEYCELNGLGYCKVVGELIAEIPCKEGTYEPNWDEMVDYEKERLN